MEDKKLTKLHNQLTTNSHARGALGGLGQENTFNFIGIKKKLVLPPNPKQPFIRYIFSSNDFVVVLLKQEQKFVMKNH